VGFGRPIVMKVTVGVYERRNFIPGSGWTPAIVDTFAGKRQMKAKIGGGMRLCVVGDFRKPGTRNHDAGGIDAAGFERLRGGSVDGMRYAEVVGVDDEEFCVARVAEFFLERFGWYLRGGSAEKNATGQREEESDVLHQEKTFRKR